MINLQKKYYEYKNYTQTDYTHSYVADTKSRLNQNIPCVTFVPYTLLNENTRLASFPCLKGLKIMIFPFSPMWSTVDCPFDWPGKKGLTLQ